MRFPLFFFFLKSKSKHAENPKQIAIQDNKYSPFFKNTNQHLKPKTPPPPPRPHPPSVCLPVEEIWSNFQISHIRKTRWRGDGARLPKHRRRRPNFWPSLSDRPHQTPVLARRDPPPPPTLSPPNLCHSQNTERAFHFARASALQEREPKLDEVWRENQAAIDSVLSQRVWGGVVWVGRLKFHWDARKLLKDLTVCAATF